VEADLKAALDVPGVLVAVIHGSWITGNRRPDSDIDVLVVGEADLRSLRRRVRSIAARSGRRIDLTLFDPEEFDALVRQGRGFIKHLSDDATLPLVGDIHELIAT
jgi:predicted nucleotidyltransferase